MKQEDEALENLLELDGVRFVIDDVLGLWIKFEARRVQMTEDRPHGIRYSLTLHDRSNHRIMGFDNSHAIEYGKKRNVSSKRIYDHWHRDNFDKGRPYIYENAAKLLEDFWQQTDKAVKKLKEV